MKLAPRSRDRRLSVHRKLLASKKLVLKHNTILRQWGFPIRKRQSMISTFNHIRVPLTTLYRWEQEEIQNGTREQAEWNKEELPWNCQECGNPLKLGEVNDGELTELACVNCGLIVERSRKNQVDYETQITQYQPALSSSFNFGLGSQVAPESLLRQIIRGVRFPPSRRSKTTLPRKTTNNKSRQKARDENYEEYGDVLRLRVLLSSVNRDRDKAVNLMLGHLTKRMREIFGFDPSSDKDMQFADLDQLGRFLRQVRVSLKGYRFNTRKAVDALLFVIYGERARQVVERPEKRLQCPRCRRERGYVKDTNPEFLLCAKCGKQIPASEARFKVSFTAIDPVYVRTIERLLPKPPPVVPSLPQEMEHSPAKLEQTPVEAVL
jgi:ribosomal protein L37AE/L43A